MVHRQDLITPDIVNYFHAFKRTVGSHRAYISIPRHFEKWHVYRDRLSDIRQPTLILWGAEDRYLSWREGARLKGHLPHAGLVIFPATGHMPMWERPDLVNREIASFLQ
jgi:pimeloyl-ACP methyl ester carboxylesterase